MKTEFDDSMILILDSVGKSKLIPKDVNNIFGYIPQTVSRQRVSTETEADHCIRTAMASKRDPLFYYFNEKTHKNKLANMNYLNSLSEVTSFLYFCQIYLPDEFLTRKFTLR